MAASKPAWRRFSCGEQPSEQVFWQETLAATQLEESIEALQERIRSHILIHTNGFRIIESKERALMALSFV